MSMLKKLSLKLKSLIAKLNKPARVTRYVGKDGKVSFRFNGSLLKP